MFFVASATAVETVRTTGAKGVLVVDDERDIRDSLKQLLEAEYPEVRVYTAESALEALKILEANRIDLVVTDYRMPGMDGLEFLERVKAQAPNARRGLITAFDPHADRRLSLKGLDFFLRKPIHIGAFIEAADRSLGSG